MDFKRRSARNSLLHADLLRSDTTAWHETVTSQLGCRNQLTAARFRPRTVLDRSEQEQVKSILVQAKPIVDVREFIIKLQTVRIYVTTPAYFRIESAEPADADPRRAREGVSQWDSLTQHNAHVYDSQAMLDR